MFSKGYSNETGYTKQCEPGALPEWITLSTHSLDLEYMTACSFDIMIHAHNIYVINIIFLTVISEFGGNDSKYYK